MNVSPFSSMNTAFTGLQAAQAALDITSQNISSSGVEGYSRQRVEQQGVAVGTSSWYLAPSAGVTVTGYERLRDGLLDRRYYDQACYSADADTRASILKQVEVSFAEPSDHGLQSLMDNFFSSWQAAANNPTSTPARTAVIDSASSLAQGFNQVDRAFQTTLTQISGEQSLHRDEIVKATDQIVDLTKQIRETILHKGSPNNLLDERDKLIDKLAGLGDISVTKYDDGNIDLSFAANPLVQTTGGVPVASYPTVSQLNNASSGTMYALNDLATNVIPGLQDKLDSIAQSLVTLVNGQHSTGYGLDGVTTGLNFFDPSGTTANSISVDLGIIGKPGKLALAGASAQPGDNSKALSISNIASQLNTVGTESINGAYGSLTSQIGSIVAQANNQQKVQGALTGAVQDQRDSVSGVSLDEEMSNLLKYQQSYGAAARVVSALDQMLEILISRTGKVGL